MSAGKSSRNSLNALALFPSVIQFHTQMSIKKISTCSSRGNSLATGGNRKQLISQRSPQQKAA